MPLVEGRPCSSGGRHRSRITRTELHKLAAERGISALSTYGRVKTMDELCHELASGYHGAGHVPAYQQPQPVVAPPANSVILNRLRQLQEDLNALKRAGAAPTVQAPVRNDRDEILRQLRQLQNRVTAPVAQAIVHAPPHDNRNEILYRLRQLQNGPPPAPDAAVLNRLRQVQQNLDELKRAGAAPALQAPARNNRDEILRQLHNIGRRMNAGDGRPQDVAGSSHPNAVREGSEVQRLRDELAELRAQVPNPANAQALGARIDDVTTKLQRVQSNLSRRGVYADDLIRQHTGEIQALNTRLQRVEEVARAHPLGQVPNPQQMANIGRNLRQLVQNVQGGQVGSQTQELIRQQHERILGLEAQVTKRDPRMNKDPGTERRVRGLESRLASAERARNAALHDVKFLGQREKLQTNKAKLEDNVADLRKHIAGRNRTISEITELGMKYKSQVEQLTTQLQQAIEHQRPLQANNRDERRLTIIEAALHEERTGRARNAQERNRLQASLEECHRRLRQPSTVMLPANPLYETDSSTTTHEPGTSGMYGASIQRSGSSASNDNVNFQDPEGEIEPEPLEESEITVANVQARNVASMAGVQPIPLSQQEKNARLLQTIRRAELERGRRPPAAPEGPSVASRVAGGLGSFALAAGSAAGGAISGGARLMQGGLVGAAGAILPQAQQQARPRPRPGRIPGFSRDNSEPALEGGPRILHNNQVHKGRLRKLPRRNYRNR